VPLSRDGLSVRAGTSRLGGRHCDLERPIVTPNVTVPGLAGGDDDRGSAGSVTPSGGGSATPPGGSGGGSATPPGGSGGGSATPPGGSGDESIPPAGSGGGSATPPGGSGGSAGDGGPG
jgi:hypothetical protein